jgi:hypothetical protein
MAGLVGGQSPSAAGDGASCVGVLDGARFPEVIPDYVAWHQLWKGVAAAQTGVPAREAVKSAIGLADEAFEALTAIAPERAADAQGIDESIKAGHRVPEHARSVLQARDKAIRHLSAADFERTQEWVETQRRSLKYRLPVAGRMRGQRCVVSVNGRLQPELIPESYAWRVYLAMLASETGRNSRSDGTLDPEYVRVQQTDVLRMPAEDIQFLYAFAKQATQDMNEYEAAFRERAANSDDPDMHRQIAINLWRQSLVSRAAVIRSMSASSWAVVEQHVDRLRHGTLFDFPTGF